MKSVSNKLLIDSYTAALPPTNPMPFFSRHAPLLTLPHPSS